MTDPELVEYCRKNLAEYPPDEVRASLLAEGLDAGDVEEALALAAAAPAAPRPKPASGPSLLAGLGWMIFFCAGISLMVAVIWHFSALENKPAKPADSGTEETPGGPAPETSAPGATFHMGHFGWAVKLGPGMTASEGLCDLKAQTEAVFFHSGGFAPRLAGDASGFLQAGAVLLQVNPRKDAQRGVLDLAALKAGYKAQARRSHFTVEDAPGLPYPAFRLRHASGRVETFLEGKRVFYHFSTLKADPTYAALTAGLSEPEPKDKLEGFLLISEDAKAGKTYLHDAAGALVTMPPDFVPTETRSGRGMRYDFAFRHRTDPFEVRLRFDPTAQATQEYQLKRQQPCWKQGTCLIPDPDAPTDAWASAVAMNMTETPFSFDMIPDRLASEDFGADWGAVSPSFLLADTKPFNQPYKNGIILQLHRSGLGNYNVMYMAGSADVLNRLTNEPAVTYCVKFAPAGR